MTAQAGARSPDEECQCCGQHHPHRKMVNLGNHPEVALCVRCAHFVSKEAWEIEDADRRTRAARVRDAFRRLRRGVVDRGWHDSRLIGRPLRWLGKFLP